MHEQLGNLKKKLQERVKNSNGNAKNENHDIKDVKFLRWAHQPTGHNKRTNQ